jgi:hypothetical protein
MNRNDWLRGLVRISSLALFATPLWTQTPPAVQTLTAGETTKQIWVANATFQINNAEAFQNIVTAQVLLQAFKANSGLDPKKAISQLQKFNSSFQSTVLATKQPYQYTQAEEVAAAFDLAAKLPAPFGKSAQTAKAAFDNMGAPVTDGLDVESQILARLTQQHHDADVQQLQNNTWSELYDLAQSNQKLRQAIDAIFSSFLKATASATTDDIFAGSADFSNSADIREIKGKIQGGQLTLTANDISTLTADTLSNLNTTVSNARTTLASIDSSQTNFVAYADDPSAQQANTAKANQQRQIDQLEISAAQSGVNLISNVAKLAGDPKLASTIGGVGGAAVQIANSISQYEQVASNLGQLGSTLGAAVMTGNIVSAVFQVVNLFSAGPSPDQLIMMQLAQLQQQVKALTTQMQQRFDQIDKQLNAT